MFVQGCDICPLIRAHRFGADAVADSFLFTVDLFKCAVQVSLPVNFVTVDLPEKYQ